MQLAQQQKELKNMGLTGHRLQRAQRGEINYGTRTGATHVGDGKARPDTKKKIRRTKMEQVAPN
jgi:hypothetical protein